MKLIEKMSNIYASNFHGCSFEESQLRCAAQQYIKEAYMHGFREALELAITRLCRVYDDDMASQIVHRINEEEV